ncbi:MAG: GTPase ObgE [Candidatus Berkelbacteria bacterium]|nr:GTPase ObgE [Candidatus Berkelbacteria bacterium]
MLVDEAKIHARAGKGGDGAATFRREKYIDKGGPDGGDGGQGGDIIIKSSNNVNTLFDFYRLKDFSSEDGMPGSKNKKHGRNANDLILNVPVGTIILDLDKNEQVADLNKENMAIIIAKGGKGGLGNVHFKSSTHQTPREFKPGAKGEEKNLKLDLKIVADIGLIGLPNAGKSTLLSVISNAKPKIADYPFTTLEPVLGVVKFKDKSFIACDIPGLIRDASVGRGLGFKFLRHILRTRVLVHLVDATSNSPESDYKNIRAELKKYDPDLEKKKEIVVLTKTDLVQKIPDNFKYDISISAATGKNINELLKIILNSL